MIPCAIFVEQLLSTPQPRSLIRPSAKWPSHGTDRGLYCPCAPTAPLLLAQPLADEDSDICGRYVSEPRAPASPQPLAEEEEVPAEEELLE